MPADKISSEAQTAQKKETRRLGIEAMNFLSPETASKEENGAEKYAIEG